MAHHSLIRILIIVSIYSLVSSTIFVLQNKKEVCLFKELKTNEHFRVNFSISGDNEFGVSCRLLGPKGETMWTSNSNNGNYNHKPEKMSDFIIGTYNLCFSQENGINHISFDFITEEEGGLVINIAKEENIVGLNKGVNEMITYFEQIEEGIKVSHTRKAVHNNIISNLIDSIKQYSFLKFVIIISISLVQIFIIRKYFESKKISINFKNPFEHSTI